MKLPLNSKENIYYKELQTRLCSGICDGAERTWREYVPGSYDPSEEMPLVIVIHGGASGGQIVLHTAEKQAAWTHVAEENGFIAVFPHSLTDTISWNVWEIYSSEHGMEYKDDVAYLDWLIDTMCEKYNINKKRIYLFGHSFGDVMATEYALKRAERLAAACLCSGPENASGYAGPDGSFRFGSDSALPVLRYHGSEDLSTPSGKWPHVTENKLVACNPGKSLMEKSGGITDEARKLKMELAQIPNILLWKHVNGSDGNISFSIKDNINIVRYGGGQPFHYVFEEKGGHFLPIYAAEYIWKYFFSTYAKCGSNRVKLAARERFEPDRNAYIFAVGASRMFWNNQPEELMHPVVRKDETDYISLDDAMRFFPVASRMLKSNKNIEIINKIEYIPFKLCVQASGLKYINNRGVTYISDHDGKLTYDMAYLIKVHLGAEKEMTLEDCLELEKAELAKFGLEMPVYTAR